VTATEAPPDELVVHILWLNAGLSCDGDSVALTARAACRIARSPSLVFIRTEMKLGAIAW